MSQNSVPCDHERLRKLLAGQLAEADEQAATQHVADCPVCQRQLEDFAGEPAWWRQMEAGLRSSSVNLKVQPVSESRVASQPGVAVNLSDDSYIADFAVAFLDPCDRPGTLGRLEDIEILEVIGHGGMGIVLKGFQRELGRYVAVKVLAPHLAASGAARTRFSREARAAAAVVHPHVMAIHAVYSSGRLPMLVMPYLACESLQQRLDRCGPLELNEILRIGHQIADGLAAAHAQGLVHRDVKPANILLERGVDRVLLTDFGLARAADDASLTRTGIIAGTPQYMSPEQARGDGVDARSDLFSLGSVLYTMSTGRPPFRAETSYGILRRITDSEPHAIREINPNIPVWLEEIIRRLHSKSADQRYASAADVAGLLSQCLAHVQQPLAASLPAECKLSLFEETSRRTTMEGTNSTPKPRPSRWLRKLVAGLVVLFAAWVLLCKGIYQKSGIRLSAQSTVQNGSQTSSTTAAYGDHSTPSNRPADITSKTSTAAWRARVKQAPSVGPKVSISALKAIKDMASGRDQRPDPFKTSPPGELASANPKAGVSHTFSNPAKPVSSAEAPPPSKPSFRTWDEDEPFPKITPPSRVVAGQPVPCRQIKPVVPVIVPAWDAMEADWKMLAQELDFSEKQDWSPVNFPRVHPGFRWAPLPTSNTDRK